VRAVWGILAPATLAAARERCRQTGPRNRSRRLLGSADSRRCDCSAKAHNSPTRVTCVRPFLGPKLMPDGGFRRRSMPMQYCLIPA